MKLPKFVLELIQARLAATAVMRQRTGNSKWKSRGFRYDLEDFIRYSNPERIDADLIPMSAAAREVMKERQGWAAHQKVGLRYEHAVPLAVLFEVLMDCPKDLEAINRTLSELFHNRWITLDEDKRLSDAGLNRKMPAGWNPTHGPWARHEHVGIE